MNGTTRMSNIKETGKKNHYFTNWATTYSCVPELYFEPEDEQQIREILDLAQRERKKVRVIGCGHSPSDICCTPDYMISMKNFNRIINIDKKTNTVTTEAGISIKELNKELHASGLAISVLGSVSEVSLAGAISTGTHGTGNNFGSLSTFIIDLDVMLASGEIVHITRESDLYRAACVSLGSLGVILRITLQCEPAFRLHQSQHPAKLCDVLDTLNAQREASDHFRFVWFPHTDGTVVWHNSRTKQPKKSSANWFWDKAIGFHLLQFCYWVSTFVPELLVPWINRIFYKLLFTTKKELVEDSFNVFAFECLFKQYVNEWSVPVEETAHVLYELKAWIENNGFPAHFPVEVRFVKGDNLLLSPSHDRDSCYINIIMYRLYDSFVPFEVYWRAFENIMKRRGGRPHWAKDYKVKREEFEKMYPKWKEFCDIRKRLDPEGLFLNANLEKLFGSDAESS